MRGRHRLGESVPPKVPQGAAHVKCEAACPSPGGRSTIHSVRWAILLVDHGSRRTEANAQLEALAELLRDRVDDAAVHVAHMELASPTIAEGFDACVQSGAEEVVVVPFFLAPGRHAREHIPELVAEAAAPHPKVRWRITDVLGVHPLLAELVLVRINERSSGRSRATKCDTRP